MDTPVEARLHARPIRELGLRIEGTRLEPLCAALRRELVELGVTGVVPRFYLSTEWGVAFDTIAIAIPFYLARPELEALHAERDGHIEGLDDADVLRYLRHEMGHVVSYAHRLYALEAWTACFGAITQPYVEEYRPVPFDRRYVRHLPGWYAQKHPDEDWAETFAVWMGRTWRTDYASAPVALGKLELCDRLMTEHGRRAPLVTDDALDEDVGELAYSLDEHYAGRAAPEDAMPDALDGGLRTIFATDADLPASRLLAALERALMEDVYRWTGHFPERTRRLVRHLRARADALQLRYRATEEPALRLALGAFVTALAMNHVYRGSYLP